MSVNNWANWIGVAMLTFFWGGPAAAVSDAEKCEAAKNKIAGKYAFCLQNAKAKAINMGYPVDYSKCEANYTHKWVVAETNGGGVCPTTGDQVAVKSCIQAHADRVTAALDNTGTCEAAPLALPASGQTTAYGVGSDGDVQAGNALSYTDNGDGTITDNNTGLMWEKKDDSGDVHDQDNYYSWCVHPDFEFVCASGGDMDGTIVTTFLAVLNGGGGFAGYTDWRIPNAKELQSIINYEGPQPSVDAAFDHSCIGCSDVTATTCSCTGRSAYWSATTNASNPTIAAWVVDFDTGVMADLPKPYGLYARAVRGGL